LLRFRWAILIYFALLPVVGGLLLILGARWRALARAFTEIDEARVTVLIVVSIVMIPTVLWFLCEAYFVFFGRRSEEASKS